MAKYTVGLDVGTTKIVAMVGAENQYGKLEIIGVGKAKSEGVSRGVVTNFAQTMQSIQAAVQQAEANAGGNLTITEVEVGIAGQHIHSTEFSDYIVREDPEKMIDFSDLEQLRQRVLRMSMLPGEEIVHILPQEYTVDDQEEVREPIGMAGSRLEAVFHVVLGQMFAIKNIGRCVTNIGLKLKGLTLEPLASAAAVLSEEEKEAGVALIDIGGGTTDLAIFKDGIIRYTAVIPYGGNVITQDIKEGCAILEKQAEALKIKFGSAWPESTRDNEIVSIPGLKGRDPKEISITMLSRIIKARLEEIIQLVFNEIENYGHKDPKKQLIAGIVLTGGGSELKDIKQLVQYITGMDTRIGYPNEHLASGTSEEITSPIYATSVGLVMTAIANEKEKIREEKLKRIYETDHTSDDKETASETDINSDATSNISEPNEEKKSSKKFFGRGLLDKFKDFLDSAE